MKTKGKIALGFAAAASLLAGGGGLFLRQQNVNTPLAQCLGAHALRATDQPVIVVPGFVNNDAYMSRLRQRLQQDGYSVYGWGAGFNVGPSREKFQALSAQLDHVYLRHGQKVKLVGYSLGGVYARELARAYPDKVDQVVTLAAPFGLVDQQGIPDRQIAALYTIAHGSKATLQDLRDAPPVPTLSVYSKNDQIVPWQASRTSTAPQAMNVEVRYGHIALAFNREVAALASAWLGGKAAPLVRCGLSPDKGV